MDKDVWRQIVCAVRSADRRVQRVGRRPRYSDQRILKIYLWTVWHDQPLCWACDRLHYSSLFRPKQLPSVSQFCRRIKTARIESMLRAVHEYLTGHKDATGVSFLDGKALPVGNYSRDPDARNGYGTGQMQRGYKLHAWATNDGLIPCFTVDPLNASEPKKARQLINEVPPGTLVLADAAYDSGPLYGDIEERGALLLTPLRGKARSGWRIRKMPASRRKAIELWDTQSDICWAILQRRKQVERIFGALSGFGGGLSPLPNWVRRLAPVRRWVTAKLVIYHARLKCRKTA